MATVSSGGPAASEQSWRELVARIARGEQNGLGALYDGSAALVYSVALRILGNAADAEEVAVDTYSDVWRTARAYDPARGSVTAWLVMLARSRAIERLRASGRAWQEQAADMELLPQETAGATLEQRQVVAAVLRRLTPEQRQLIELAFYSGESHTEIARRLGWPLGTVKTRIRVAISKLRDLLGTVRT